MNIKQQISARHFSGVSQRDETRWQAHAQISLCAIVSLQWSERNVSAYATVEMCTRTREWAHEWEHGNVCEALKGAE